MPASFTKDLCRYRGHGKPNTSDASDKASVAVGNALFSALEVDPAARGDEPTGSPFADLVAADLRRRVELARSTHEVSTEKALNAFQQYRHVGALADIEVDPSKEYTKAWGRLKVEMGRAASTADAVIRASRLIDEVEAAVTAEAARRRRALYEVGSESLLNLDVTVSEPQPGWLPELKVGLSLKWTLRTDRAQDCRSQGAKLSALRRGRMPHFAALTMEPRPYMLNLLGGGSGDVDCVYHLHLPALTEAIATVYGQRTDKNSKRTLATFERLVEQRRLRDYDELVDHVLVL